MMHEVATSLSNGYTHKLTFRDMLFSKPVPLSLPIIGLQGLRTATEQTASVLTGSDRMHAHTSHSSHGSLDVRFVAVDLPHYLSVYFRLKCEWQRDPCSLPKLTSKRHDKMAKQELIWNLKHRSQSRRAYLQLASE